MNLGRSDCITVHHLIDSIESHKLYIGCSGYLLSNSFPTLTKYTPNSWITNIWKFLFEKNMVIEENTPDLKPQCLKDSHIMENVIRRVIQGGKPAELNRFHIWLKATCLSYLASGDGKYISPTLCIGNSISWTPNTNSLPNQAPTKSPGKICNHIFSPTKTSQYH